MAIIINKTIPLGTSALMDQVNKWGKLGSSVVLDSMKQATPKLDKMWTNPVFKESELDRFLNAPIPDLQKKARFLNGLFFCLV